MAATKPPKPLTAKKLDAEIERIYKENANGRQIDIMDIGKVFKAGKDAYAQTPTLEALTTAVVDAIGKYTTPA